MSKPISITEKKIARILKSLPSNHLLEYIETEEQLRFWLADRFLQGLVSQCWQAYLTGANNPIEPLVRAGKLKQDIYDRAWKLTHFYLALWGLVQLAQPHVEAELEGTGLEHFAESADLLFTRIAWSDSNRSFEDCFKPYLEVSARKREKMYRLAAKGCEEGLDAEEKKELHQCLPKQSTDWLMVAFFAIATKYSKKDNALRDRLETYNTELGRLCIKEATISRKAGSFAWKNGEIKEASRYGGTYSS